MRASLSAGDPAQMIALSVRDLEGSIWGHRNAAPSGLNLLLFTLGSLPEQK
jgi:hypothetical protein